MNRFTKIRITQHRESSGSFRYRIFIDGLVRRSVLNTRPRTFYNVKCFLGDPWYRPARAFVKNLKIKTSSSGKWKMLEINLDKKSKINNIHIQHTYFRYKCDVSARTMSGSFLGRYNNIYDIKIWATFRNGILPYARTKHVSLRRPYRFNIQHLSGPKLKSCQGQGVRIYYLTSLFDRSKSYLVKCENDLSQELVIGQT